MYVEVRKAGFVNKGAELMLHAVLQQLAERYPDAKRVMEPGRPASPYPYAKRSELGLYQKAWLWRKGVPFGDLARLVPAGIREQYGVVLDSEIDVVLDAAGFAYSDQWGPELSEELARSARRWHARGTKVILLPQAFGPFTDQRSKDAVKAFVEHCDLIYTREQISYEHLTGVVGEMDKIRLSPDFTNLVEGVVPKDFDAGRNRVCLVPNYRMLDKTDNSVAGGYVPFMQRVAKMLSERGAQPFLLVHEGENDYRLAQQIAEAGGGLPIIQESDPLKIKGILGQCQGTVGSRFHGLVSALSQGVPSLATGWSHKYRMLFADYGFEEGVLNIDISDADLAGALNHITDPQRHAQLSAQLNDHSSALKEKSHAMWREVFGVMDRCRAAQSAVASREPTPA
ncbi:colanic acid/amylovoran biosynthesis protein [Halopseudomonas xinjiangensis]|uniref:Colanic acid/amylovoran biosynthesis protein n=1 Tax=Halopseudomonas xinjiangensis TaxID=487184 RepID=A0A1H1R383_9GAMM|nr:polysaccharide pyruvyl transferase family protein [Halopseudomonas xinjiangensis]SDS30080.1 colanic acid/amylovoran biosynthesis protein [Halopseudomonas xinjiangensis]